MIRQIVFTIPIFVGVATNGCAEANIYSDSVSQFSLATGALATIVGTELDSARSRIRLNQIRRLATTTIVQGTAVSQGSLQLRGFVCAPRISAARVGAQSTYLRNVAGAISKQTKSSNQGLVALAVALFKDYSISVSHADSDEAIKKHIIEPCIDDLENFTSTAYGLGKPTQEAGVVAAAIALIEVFKEVVLPIVEQGLGEVDNARRTKAIRDFLKNEENRTSMRRSLTQLDVFLRRSFQYSRHMALFKLEERRVEFLSMNIDPKSIHGCGEFYKLDKKERSGAREAIKQSAFHACFRSLWVKWNDQVPKFLEAASQYDIEADKNFGDAIKNVRETVDRLNDVSDGKLSGKEAEALFGSVVRIVNIVNKVEEANSEENRKKIQDAIKNLLNRT